MSALNHNATHLQANVSTLFVICFFFQVKACCEHAITFVPKKSYEGSQLQNLVSEQAVASYIGHYKHVIISKGKTLQENWKLKPQSSWIHDQNANTSRIFLPALCQMNWKW